MNPETNLDIAVIGGGAAGYFAALRAASCRPGTKIAVLEAGKRPLEKVRISGGGRCNVTHHCFEPARLVVGYPRGAKELRGPFHHFQPQDTVAWFAERGVQLKAEEDGRMFPVTDSSETIISCFESERRRLGVQLETSARVKELMPQGDRGFDVVVERAKPGGSTCYAARFVMLATGSNRSGYAMAKSCGHRITPLVPSLFTFVVEDQKLTSLAGISVDDALVTFHIGGEEIASQHGPLLITHWGLSGPAVLKLSAFAAAELYAADYKGILRVQWSGGESHESVRSRIATMKVSSPRKALINTPLFDVPSRLWEYLLRRELPAECERTWADASKGILEKLVSLILRTDFTISGKGQFKDEFVTCGGVATEEVDFRTMESKFCPGLFLGGEILNVDGITGGYNFQSAWTTGWLAGSAMAERLS